MRPVPSPVTVAAAALALLVTEPARAQTPTPTHRELVYATAPTNSGPVNLVLDLYLPPNPPKPVPCVVWIHGGGWSSGKRTNPAGAFLVNYGVAVASIDYRLSGQARWPAQLHDCKAAIRWLRANAQTYGLDPRRFGVWGESAGGHLAAMVGVTADVGTARIGESVDDLEGTVGDDLAQPSRVQAVVNWYGSTGFLAMSSFPGAVDHDAADSPESLLLGAPIRTVPIAVAMAEPATFLSPDDPPMLTKHGTHDPLVPFHQGEQLVRQGVGGWGLDYRFVPVAFGNHGSSSGFTPVEGGRFLLEQLIAPRATVSLHAVGGPLVEGGAGVAAVRVLRTGSLAEELFVQVASTGSAREGDDFSLVGSVARIPPGQAFVDLPLAARDDALVEGEEVVRFSLCAQPTYLVDPYAATVAWPLFDDEVQAGLPTVLVVAVDAVGDENGDPARLDVLRSGPVTAPLVVDLAVQGTATNGVDYAAISRQVTIPAGASRVPLQILPSADARWESTETVIVTARPGVGYRVGVRPSAHAQIRDVVAAAPAVAVTVGDPTCSERGDVGAFRLTRTGGLGAPLAVSVTLRGSATAGVDYVAPPLTVTFGVGELITFVPITPTDDPDVEGDETVELEVLPGGGYVTGFQASAVLTIDDDDVSLPPVSEFVLDLGAVRVGEASVCTLLDRRPMQPYAVLLSVGTTLRWLPGANYPLLVDDIGLGLGARATGVLDATGRAVFGLQLTDSPILVGANLGLQAVSLPGSGGAIRVSGMVRREVMQ